MKYLNRISIKIFYTLILLSIPLLLISCSGNVNKKENNAISGTPVSITTPVVMNLQDDLKLNANVIFLNKEMVRVPFPGFIEKIYKNIGDEVNPGDVLFRVKTKESAASDSLKIKIGDKIFDGSVLIGAKTRGVLTELNYHKGDFISEGEQLAIVSNPNSLRIKLNVPFEDAQKIKVGNNCDVDLPGGEQLTGYIEKKVPSVDPSTQTQTFLIKLKSHKELPENLNVITKIPFRSFKDATVVPKSAVMTNVTEDVFWIMKLLNDTTAVRIDINKGIETESLVQILSPKLNVSDKIISSGSYGLPDTAKVEVIK